LLTGREVHDHYLPPIRHVNIGAPDIRIELEGLGVGWKLRTAHDRPALRVQHRETTSAVAYDHAPGSSINPDIIGVLAEGDSAGGLQVLAPEQAHRPVPGTRDSNEVRQGSVTDALRLTQPADAMDGFARSEVDHVYATVAQLGHEQAPTAEVNSYVVNPPGDARQWYRALQHQGRIRLGWPELAGQQPKDKRETAESCPPSCSRCHGLTPISSRLAAFVKAVRTNVTQSNLGRLKLKLIVMILVF